MTAQLRLAGWWRLLHAALAVAVVTLLGAGTASALTVPVLETRVGASTPAAQVAIGVHESISAGQRWGNAPPDADSVVATGVAANGATEVAGLMGPKGNVVVLGRLEDTAVAKTWPGHTVLDMPNWSLELNDAFIGQTIKESRTVYLASPLDGNLIQTAGKYAGQPTIYARELEQLTNAGYTRVGDYLRPPGS